MPYLADGHADSLMWNRDLNRKSSQGHVDIPRLLEAGVGLQCFTLVTRGFPFIGGFPLFAAAQGWPRDALRGEWARANWQIDQLERFCQASGDKAAITVSSDAIDDNARAGRLSAIIGVEGAHALEGKVERVQRLHARGVRFMSLTHLSNNELGGSSFPFMGNRPLSALGHEIVEAMAQVGMSVDIAHASPRTLDDLIAHKNARLFSSHTGVRGAANKWRNVSDEVLRAVADRGGVVGIIFATVYLGGKSLEDVARHIEHAVNVMGEDAVSLGSDFDGMIPLPQGMRDVLDVPKLGDVLRARKHPNRRVEKILGLNLHRYFSETLI
ncbi:MAG: dipeptidase [Myxococcaceae bacterium]